MHTLYISVFKETKIMCPTDSEAKIANNLYYLKIYYFACSALNTPK